jgi:shikimate 5-dehydrogenase
MSYKPRQTPLMTAAQQNQGWDRVTGVEALLAQAFDQSLLWTGFEPPREIMTEAHCGTW